MDTEKLRELIKSHPKNQTKIGEDLGFNKSKMSRLVNGSNIDESDQKLLKLYFYGIIPFETLAPKEGYKDDLEFTPDEWRIMDIIAKRSGFKSTKKWIVSQIRGYLAYCASSSATEEQTPDITPRINEDTSHKPTLYAAAGSPILAENIEWNGGKVFVTAVGDSMIPLVQDGGTLEMTHFTQSRSPFMKKDLIYLVRIDNEHAIKKYDTRPPRPDEMDAEYLTETGSVGQLVSLNKEHETIDITTTDFAWEAWYDPKSKV